MGVTTVPYGPLAGQRSGYGGQAAPRGPDVYLVGGALSATQNLDEGVVNPPFCRRCRSSYSETVPRIEGAIEAQRLKGLPDSRSEASRGQHAAVMHGSR